MTCAPCLIWWRTASTTSHGPLAIPWARAPLEHTGRESRHVAVPACDPEWIARWDHARCRDVAALDGFRQRHGDVAAKVPHRREAGHHRRSAVPRRFEGRVDFGMRDRLDEGGGADLERQMRVRVDEAGHQRHIAEVDDLRSRRWRRRVDGGDPITLDDDRGTAEHLSAGDVEQPRSAHRHGGRLLRLLRGQRDRRRKRQGGPAQTGEGHARE